MKTKKWTFNIKGDTFFIGERISTDVVFATTEQKAYEIMANGYSVNPKELEVVSVEDVELYGNLDRRAVGWGSKLVDSD